jgi:hypothetical protein
MGLSELGPLGKRYLLRPEGEPFVGKAIFSVGGGPNVTTRELPISIPRETIQEFLRLLSEAPLEKGTYHPSITHTDDYPSQKIDLVRADAQLSFYSESQGDTAVPWGATFGGENYTVNSKNPADALAKIRPYLKGGDFQKFTEEMRTSFLKKGK